MGTQPIDYCRQVESYLCQKNDGHLIRVVGPAFDLVSRWAEQGIPLKVAFQGIDRYFERHYQKTRAGNIRPRRRPVRIDFCEADVLDVFDEWRRAVGLPASALAAPVQRDEQEAAVRPRSTPLATHLERAVLRLTNARAMGAVGPGVESVLDRLSRELDAARQVSRGLRGDARKALIERLTGLDAELLSAARSGLADAEAVQLEREAESAVSPYRDRLSSEAYARARNAAFDRLVRERLNLPTLVFPQP